MQSEQKQTVFLCLEGGEAVGKSNQIRLLEKLFKENNISCLKTREPGGIKSSEDIRNVIFSNDVDSITEFLLFSASRHENIKKVIIPNFNKYDVIIVDRFVLSTIIYQGILGGIDVNKIIDLHNNFNFNLYPDLTIILDDDIDRVMLRLNNRKKDLQNRIDKNSKDFHAEIIKNFRNPSEFYKGKFEVIDGSSKSLLEVHSAIVEFINSYFNKDLKPLDKIN
jgi:dTMP kinase